MPKNNNKIDLDLFENVLLYNCIFGKFKEQYISQIAEYLDKDYFQDTNRAMVAGVLRDFFERTNAIPNATEISLAFSDSNEKRALKGVLAGFKGIDTNYNEGELVKNTETFLRQRIAQNIIEQATDDSIDGKILDISTIYTDLEKAVNVCLTDDMGLDLINDFDKIETNMLKVNRAHSTGYPWLDDQIQGGFVADEGALYMFGGATNVGKSNLLANFAVNLLNQNLKVLVISLEMSEFVYARRLISMLSEVYLDEMKDKVGDIKQFIKNYKTKNKQSQLFIKQFPTASVHYKNLDHYIAKLYQMYKFDPDVVFVDYPGIMIPFTPTGKHDMDIKRAHEEVRALSIMHQKSYAAVLQLNKDGYDVAKPGLKTTGGSIGISQTADLQANLFATEEHLAMNQIGISINKSRFGPVRGSTTFDINPNNLKITQGENPYDFSANDQKKSVSEIDKLISDF